MEGSHSHPKSISNLVAADPFCHKLFNLLHSLRGKLTRLPLTAEIRHCHGCPFGSRPVVVANRYTLNRSLNHTHDHRLTLDSPPNSGVARLACFIDSRSKNLRRCVRLPPYTPASLSVVYSRIFRRASGGSSGDNNMRLMTAADRPECLWLALRTVQVVLRASPSASDCWSRVTNPASMSDCPSSRIFAACRDFISVTTDAPFRWDERWAWFRCAFIIPSRASMCTL